MNLRELYTLVTGIMLIVLFFAVLAFVDNTTLASDFRNELYRFDFYADHHHGLYDKHIYLPLIMQGGPIGTPTSNDNPANAPVRASTPTSTDTPTPAGNSTSTSSVVPLVIPQESGVLRNPFVFFALRVLRPLRVFVIQTPFRP